MSKWKNIKTYMEVNPYTGQPIDEDMPTNAAGRGAVAGIGVGPDGEPGYDPKKKKRKRTLIDARSKSYRQHRARLEKARAKREEKKSKLAQKVAEDTLNFEREKFIEEDNSEQIKKLEKMLKDLERQKKKTPGGGFAKMKIKQLIADLKGLRETTHTKDYETFVQLYTKILKAVDDASKELNKIPGVGQGPMGLTDPKVKSSSKYKIARANYQRLDTLRKKFLKGVPKDFLRNTLSNCSQEEKILTK